jgi:hypothetical protein
MWRNIVKKSVLYSICFLMLLVSLPLGMAQEKAKVDEKPKVEAPLSTTPVKVQIVFTEFEGEKKVKSLPYALYANALDSGELKSGWTKLRIGSRVPIYVGNSQMQYIDVGTNIDARTAHTDDGHLLLQLALERSWVEGDVSVPVTKSDAAQTDSASGHFKEPIIRTFRSELELKLREGQSVESTVAADPISGKVMKAEVSFSVVK